MLIGTVWLSTTRFIVAWSCMDLSLPDKLSDDIASSLSAPLTLSDQLNSLSQTKLPFTNSSSHKAIVYLVEPRTAVQWTTASVSHAHSHNWKRFQYVELECFNSKDTWPKY